ncbi:hypothetical protein IKP13_09595 [bacterium]|jgi:hypothetical protein|nr:hypothetical protein [bacterium]
MENDVIHIEYEKFSSFIKDCIKNYSRGHFFLISDEERDAGETFPFMIEVKGLKKTLGAVATVVSSGMNEAGERGVEVEFSFDDESRNFINGTLKEIVIRRYGGLWGTKLSNLF